MPVVVARLANRRYTDPVTKTREAPDTEEIRQVLRDVSKQIEDLRSVLSDLMERQTEMFRLLREQGLVFREIAEDAGITPEGVMRRIKSHDAPAR